MKLKILWRILADLLQKHKTIHSVIPPILLPFQSQKVGVEIIETVLEVFDALIIAQIPNEDLTFPSIFRNPCLTRRISVEYLDVFPQLIQVGLN